MKKMFFSLIATGMASSFASANTIEIKEVLPNEKIENFSNFQNEIDDITVCYEVGRSYSRPNQFVTIETITYACFKHEGLGNGTVFINGNN